MADQALFALSPVQRAGLSSAQRAALVDVERLAGRRARLVEELAVCEGRLRDAAVSAALGGCSPTVVGAAAGVTRGTVHKWLQRRRSAAAAAA